MKLIITLLLVSLSGLFSYGQPENTAFRNLTSSEGLPSTSLADVTQDATGLIWIATWEGAYRYDGKNFTRIVARDTRRLEADEKGGVWLSFSDMGTIGYYDTHTDQLKIYNVPRINRSPEIKIDDEGQVWAALENGIARFDAEADSFLLDRNSQPYRGGYLSARGEGHLDFITSDSIYGNFIIGHRYSNGTYTFEKLPVDNNNPDPGKSFVDKSPPFGMIPYGETGLIIINEFGWAIKDKAENDWVFYKTANTDIISEFRGVTMDLQGNLWLNQVNALSKINLTSRLVTTYFHAEEDPSSILPLRTMGPGNSIFIDRQGILWSTRYGQGISTLNLYAGDFGLLRDNKGDPIPDVLSALELEDGSFFIGNRTNPIGLYHFDSTGRIIRTYGTPSFEAPKGRTISNQMSHPFTWAIAATSDGSIWAGTGWPREDDGGLNRIRPGSNEIKRFKYDSLNTNSIPDNWVRQLMVDKAGRLWIRTTRKGWCWMDTESETITRGSELKDPDLKEILESGGRGFINLEGNLVLGSNQEYHEINNSTLQVAPYIHLKDTTENIRLILQDEQGRLWFTSKNGFGYLEAPFKEIAYFFDIKNGNFPSDEVITLNLDKGGLVWLATNKGIIRFDLGQEKWIHFGYERGLQDNYFNSIVNTRGPSGKIYFAGTGGVNIIDPDLIMINPFPPDMVFTLLKMDEKTIAPGPDSPLSQPIEIAQSIIVSPEISVISIDFAAIHFAGISSNRYQYKLEGFDKGWRDGGTNGNATYTNLSSGKYRLFIRGSNWDNVWSDGTKSIEIHILPPWWKTWWAYVIYSVIIVFLGLQLHLFIKKRTIRKEREKSQQRELEQAREIEKAYTRLKTTQDQLIHSEKMASLGELTAGIAHEIQNPLNFVNNFSDVSVDLLGELQEEVVAGNNDEVSAILDDLKLNLGKITQHGKRASGIVKGMLEHSRTGSAEKQATDIKALADEYLRLAYHGLRAKDKSFNADFKLEADDDMPKISVVGQDIGRVLLNLINNAFYAVSEKAKQNLDGYKPHVNITLKNLDKHIEIKINDNGYGIPENIKEKIFQPFFTTKPSGQGTGLGLSMSFDIITKGHGGTMDVISTSGEGSEFIIRIPKS